MKAIFASIAMTATIAAAPAAAGTMSVKYDDLDLSSKAGIEQLDNRIAAAAREMCGFNEQRTGSRMASRASKRCVSEASAQAKKQFAAVIEQQRKGG